jgi:hypothetical protein
MRYEQIVGCKPEKFQRLTGVKPAVFEQMLACCVPQDGQGQRGRPCTLGAADRLLMTLMYWREYRTPAHIAVTYGVSEPTVCRTIRYVEARLMASGKFALPGKKVLQEPRLAFDVVIVDATEVPLQRPKKSKSATTAVRKSGTRTKRKS